MLLGADRHVGRAGGRRPPLQRSSAGPCEKILPRRGNDIKCNRPGFRGGDKFNVAPSTEHCIAHEPISAHERRRMSRDKSPIRNAATGTLVPYSTVTLLARLRGWSTSVPFATAAW